MSNNVYQFMDLQRVDPTKRLLTSRRIDFVEIYTSFAEEQARTQADRCIACGNPYCEWRCPVHNYIPDWLKLAHEGRIIEAAELSHQTNSLPEVCGRVCPQDRLCEGACTLNDEFGAVTIGHIERYINDRALEMGWRPDLSNVVFDGKKVAIIGAGPAGLACADVLTRHGVKAVVFDRHPEIGGLLTFGIPAFKLEKSVMIRRRELFSAMGIQFELNTEVGRDVQMDVLMREFDALFVAVGALQPLAGGLQNEEAVGVHSALPYLIGNTRQLMSLPTNAQYPYINFKDQRVVVLGGGDTAMDCVRTAIRQQAKEVICAYRRDEESMPGSRREIENAREEGVLFKFNLQPRAIEIDRANRTCGVRMVTTKSGPASAGARGQVQEITGSEQVLAADAVVMAFGFRPHHMAWLQDYTVALDVRGRIQVDQRAYRYQSSNPKIFAGGDIVRGADLVVTAIADGRGAAENIIQYLRQPG